MLLFLEILRKALKLRFKRQSAQGFIPPGATTEGAL